MKPCQRCGRPVKKRGREHCSTRCAAEARRLPLRACRRCGDPVKRYDRKHCSPECATAAHRKPRKVCGWCGEKPASRIDGVYCSRACAGRANSERQLKVTRKRCPWCQEMFSQHSTKQVYCSRGCAVRARAITMDDAQRAAQFKRMGALASATRRRKKMLRWLEASKGMTPAQAAERFYKQGFSAGWQAGARGRKFPKEWAA